MIHVSTQERLQLNFTSYRYVGQWVPQQWHTWVRYARGIALPPAHMAAHARAGARQAKGAGRGPQPAGGLHFPDWGLASAMMCALLCRWWATRGQGYAAAAKGILTGLILAFIPEESLVWHVATEVQGSVWPVVTAVACPVQRRMVLLGPLLHGDQAFRRMATRST